MPRMEKKDILHLATLSRIRITNEEAEALTSDIEAVLSYVSVVSEIAADAHLTKKVGAVFNVFREDEVTIPSDSFTEAILKEAPHVKGRHLKVKKIIQQD